MEVFETKTYKKMLKWEANNQPEYIVVHHTGGSDNNPLADTSHHTATMVEDWHLKKGWDGIGYHYFIEKNGDVWKGRPEHRNGAHCKAVNTKSIGVCLAGNFDFTKPTKQQEKALTKLLIDIKGRHNILINKIVPHRHFDKKTCYGIKLPNEWARNLVVKPVSSLDEFTTLELLKIAKERKDFYASLLKLFS